MIKFLKKAQLSKTDLIKFKIRIAVYLVKKLSHKVCSKKTPSPKSFIVNSLKHLRTIDTNITQT